MDSANPAALKKKLMIAANWGAPFANAFATRVIPVAMSLMSPGSCGARAFSSPPNALATAWIAVAIAGWANAMISESANSLKGPAIVLIADVSGSTRADSVACAVPSMEISTVLNGTDIAVSAEAADLP